MIIGRIATGEAVKRMLDDCRAMEVQLLTEGANPLEKLLVERIVLCWLRLQYAEQYATRMMFSGESWVQIEYVDAMLGRAQHRYLKAIESLARVRKLLGRIKG